MSNQPPHSQPYWKQMCDATAHYNKLQLHCTAGGCNINSCKVSIKWSASAQLVEICSHNCGESSKGKKVEIKWDASSNRKYI